MFDTKVEELVGMSLTELAQYVPPSVVSMIEEIIRVIHERRQMIGCELEISDRNGITRHVIAGFPIVKACTEDTQLFSIMIIKQPFGSELEHQTILSGTYAGVLSDI